MHAGAEQCEMRDAFRHAAPDFKRDTAAHAVPGQRELIRRLRQRAVDHCREAVRLAIAIDAGNGAAIAQGLMLRCPDAGITDKSRQQQQSCCLSLRVAHADPITSYI
jgi:hypothetical protein